MRYYPSVCLEGLRKAMKIFIQNSQVLGASCEPSTWGIESRNVTHSTVKCTLVFYGILFVSAVLVLFPCNAQFKECRRKWRFLWTRSRGLLYINESENWNVWKLVSLLLSKYPFRHISGFYITKGSSELIPDNSARYALQRNEMAAFVERLILLPPSGGAVIAKSVSVQSKYFNLNQYPFVFFRRRKWESPEVKGKHWLATSQQQPPRSKFYFW